MLKNIVSIKTLMYSNTFVMINAF